jgi:drug/metabolite transporter (DMT)-like permease
MLQINKNHLLGIFFSFLAFFIWGGITPFIVKTISLPAPVITFFSYCFGSLILLLLAFFKDKFQDINLALRALTTNEKVLLGFVASITSMFCHVAFKLLPIGNAVLILALIPTFTVYFNSKFNSIASTKETRAGLFIGFLGIFVSFLSKTSVEISILGIICALLGALGFAFFNVYAEKIKRKVSTLRPESITFIYTCYGTYSLFIPAVLGLFIPFGIEVSIINNLTKLLVFAILNMVIASTVYMYAIRFVSTNIVTAFAYTEPMWAAAIGLMFLGEVLTLNFIFGLILVIFSTVILTSKKTDERKSTI